MKVTPELARRERPARAAAPKQSMMEHDSEDEDPPIEPSGSSSVKGTRSENTASISENSPASITLISGISDCAMATLNQPSSPKKRSMAETKNDSPTKKPRKIVIKSNKLAGYTVTPAPSQAEISPQPDSDIIPALQTITKCTETLQSRIAKDATELAEAKKKIASLERMLEAKAGGDDLTNIADADLDLRKENHQLKIRVSELKHHVAALQQRPAIPDFKVMDEDVETCWQEIGFDIRNFVAQVLTNKPHGVKTPFGAIHKDVESFKKHQKKDISTAPYHFQSYIWERLVEDVFQAGKPTWGGDAGNAFHRYCLNVSEIDCEGMEQLSLFKAIQADSLSGSFNDHNREHATGIAQGMALTLDIFMDPNKDKVNAKKSLMSIVKKAMMLNARFLRSRAFFLTNWIVEDFEEEDLDIRYRAGKQGGEMKLDIQISPRLRKIGNADGRRFDQAMEICKPMVTVIYR
ncbi:uncharacterized protein FIESC28_08967 [Fusarium coffeatum]|uniref:Uncharacterized protein n=1 Tax=Fusarium coffeatum TaxID=231269 RepID=A0A366R5N9_9HYPO|nr:uncharacterized protein FIESC28_08967 [Fusarium coffeatum]RBR11505.1 hypothetical protein FIESC28_08967 [Fusarium coffeatum]